MAEGGASDINRMYSYRAEQVIRVREGPTNGGARACVTGVTSQCVTNVHLDQDYFSWS